MSFVSINSFAIIGLKVIGRFRFELRIISRKSKPKFRYFSFNLSDNVKKAAVEQVPVFFNVTITEKKCNTVELY